MAGCSGTRETCNGWNAAACRPPSCSPRARPVPRSPASWACRRRPPAAGMRAGVLAVWRECAPPATASRHAWAPPSWPGSAGCWTAGRWRPGSTTTCGPLRARRGHRADHRGGASSRARVAPPQGDAVEPAAPNPQGPRARRGRDCPVGRPGVAADRANAQTRKAWLCFVDESGVKLTPPVRRTWAPRGKTPVLRHPYRRGKQISMCGLVAYRPGAGQGEPPAAWMGFDLLEGAYDTAAFIRVLDGLGHQVGHQPVTVIWDNLGAHHAGDLHAWAATQPWLVLEYLPSYAPELDPVEGLWANLKGRELANRCCADRRELIATAQVGSILARRDPELLRSFLAGTGLTI